MHSLYLLKYYLFDYISNVSDNKKLEITGAQIIDLMILVIDVTKGMQTQTAECIIIGEITCSRLIVVLNKVDLLKSEKRLETINKVIITGVK